jgi:hypothetical protein
MALQEPILAVMVDLKTAKLQYEMAYEAMIGVVLLRKFVFIRYIAGNQKTTLECVSFQCEGGACDITPQTP